MDLYEALSLPVHFKGIISFVGGGGKTSAIFRLARELKRLRRKVLITTTTAIYVPDRSTYDYFFVGNEAADAALKSIGGGTVTVIGREITPENKLKGILNETVDELADQGFFDAILVEADGSKSRPIKAPASHEPVIPSKTSILTGLIGFDCYGKPLDSEWTHRPEILSALTGTLIGGNIGGDVIAKLVVSPQGLFKDCPDDAQRILFFNKVQSRADQMQAEKIGNALLDGGHGIVAVILGAVLEEPPVRCILKRSSWQPQ